MRAIARSFTRLDQVTQLVNASEADADGAQAARLDGVARRRWRQQMPA